MNNIEINTQENRKVDDIRVMVYPKVFDIANGKQESVEDIFKNEKRVTVEATLTEKAYTQLLNYYDAGIKHGMHNLTIEEFIGWMAATGTWGLIKGEVEKKQNENEGGKK